MKKLGFSLLLLFCFCILGSFIYHCLFRVLPVESNAKLGQKAEVLIKPAIIDLNEKKRLDNQAQYEKNTVLMNKIKSLTDNETGIYAAYVFYPTESNREPIIYNSQSMRSASMIKVYIMAAVYEKILQGKISDSQTVVLRQDMKVGGAGSLIGWKNGSEITVQKLLHMMITESDNTATNILIDLVGMDTVNQYMQQNGYKDSVLGRKMMDMAAVRDGNDNYTSVNDLGRFFTKLYFHTVINEKYDKLMVDLLLQQTDDECFPAVLHGQKIAHKTGELDRLYDDGGIIYGEKDVIIVVMSDKYGYRSQCIKTLQRIAVAVLENG